MLARVCAAQMARTIVRALHVSPPEIQARPAEPVTPKPKSAKGRKKRKAA